MMHPQDSKRRLTSSPIGILKALFAVMLSCGIVFSSSVAFARMGATPWSSDVNFQSLVYGASSTNDVVRAMGAPPDDIVRSQQMYPPIENFYYYDENKTGAATIFVFENGFLVGMQLKTAGNQLVDMTYFLANNGDRALNSPMLGGYMPYYFNNYYPQYPSIPFGRPR